MKSLLYRTNVSHKGWEKKGWSSCRKIRFFAAARSSFCFLATADRSTTFIAYRHSSPSPLPTPVSSGGGTVVDYLSLFIPHQKVTYCKHATIEAD
uniref:Uncharacterized protein n=1 Tax=Oryza glumipatula TaxID=40148 RepID=A0A0E0BMY6_9ORYZ